jgi:anti-sigma factor RsiW
MVDRDDVKRETVNCELVWREISNYVEGDVSPALRAAMDEHFHTCQRCASVLTGMRSVIRLYGDERMMEVPAGFGRRLERRLAQSARVSSSRWSSLSAWLVPVAALALVAAGLWLTNSLATERALKSEMEQRKSAHADCKGGAARGLCPVHALPEEVSGAGDGGKCGAGNAGVCRHGCGG